ncbi:hypothetical protein ACFYO2_46550 [Streptomyces sp. NPDC006602]|uniref:hypothetical protein n=1 Tax=Streptomyces sp. NPDC006602 TaxID=3364751 RepID=UPI0036B90A5F
MPPTSASTISGPIRTSAIRTDSRRRGIRPWSSADRDGWATDECSAAAPSRRDESIHATSDESSAIAVPVVAWDP